MNVSVWAAILIVVLIFGAVTMTRKRDMAQKADQEHERVEQQREIEELRERVRVLERIVVDENDTVRLSAEIESLRDE